MYMPNETAAAHERALAALRKKSNNAPTSFDVQSAVARAQNANPFAMGSKNLTDMSILKRHAPALAASLEEEAARAGVAA